MFATVTHAITINDPTTAFVLAYEMTMSSIEAGLTETQVSNMIRVNGLVTRTYRYPCAHASIVKPRGSVGLETSITCPFPVASSPDCWDILVGMIG